MSEPMDLYECRKCRCGVLWPRKDWLRLGEEEIDGVMLVMYVLPCQNKLCQRPFIEKRSGATTEILED